VLLLLALSVAGIALASLAAGAPAAPLAQSAPAVSAPATVLAADAPQASSALVAAASTPVVVPPALQALEQKMEQIRFSSLRFSRRLDLRVPDSTHSNGITISTSAASTHHIVISSTGVLGLSPLLLSSTSTTSERVAPGEAVAPFRQERRIGTATYVYDPSITRRDGGRPWIRSVRSRKDERLAAKLAPLTAVLDPVLAGLERSAASSNGPFAPLLEMLGGTLSIQETGPATVDGQQTLAFTATLSTARLVERIFSAKELRSLNGGKPPPNSDFTLELWIAPSGLPVRAVTTSDIHGEEFNSQEDILGLDVPVLVHAPPADRTISQARLIELDRRRAKAVSRCIRHHPRRTQACIKRWVGLN
jgi:hypothetical protein